MSTKLKEAIETRAAANRLSIAELERRAGLKMNAIRNILKGKSKNPRVETLNSVAKVLGCSLEELIQNIKHNNAKSPTQKNYFEIKEVENIGLALDITDNITKLLREKKYSISMDKLFFLINESYNYLLKGNPPKVDPIFIEWYIEKNK